MGEMRPSGFARGKEAGGWRGEAGEATGPDPIQAEREDVECAEAPGPGAGLGSLRQRP